MAGGDWIKLHRRIVRHWVFADESVFYLWTNLLMRANWKDGKFWPGGASAPVVVKRGQLLTGRNSLHAMLYPKRDAEGRTIKRDRKPPHATTVWRWLEAMAKDGMIALDVRSAFTIITICQYETYQTAKDASAQGDAPETRKACASDAQGVRTIEERQELTLSLSFAGKLVPRFDTPEVRSLIPGWIRHWPKVHDGKPLDDQQLEFQLMDCARLGWDGPTLCASITKSIAKDARNLLPPDDANGYGHGAKPAEKTYRKLTEPRR